MQAPTIFLTLFALVLSALVGRSSTRETRGENGLEKLVISLFYETKCPYSVQFNREQLYPLYSKSKLSDYIQMDYVPYGKAKSSKNPDGIYNFTCQHGEDECYGNKLHSCALSRLPSELGIHFVGCALSSIHPHSGGFACARELKLRNSQWQQLKHCADGEEGDALLWANGKRTNALSPPLQHVPWKLFNGLFSQAEDDEAYSSLLGVVCRHL